MQSRHYYKAIIIIVITSAIVRFFSATPLSGTDCINYAQAANEFIEHNFSLKFNLNLFPLYFLRLGILITTSVVIFFFGSSSCVLSLSMIAIYIFIAFAFAILIRKVLSNELSLLFLLISAFIPIDISMSTKLYPDYHFLFFVNLAFLFYFFKIKFSKGRIFDLYTGMLIGAGWFFKESAVYSIPILFVLILLYEKNITSKFLCILLMIIGFSCLFLLEILLSKFFTGEYFTRLNSLAKFPPEIQTNLYFNEGSIIGYEKGNYLPALLKRLFIEGPLFIFFSKNFSLIILFAFLFGIKRTFSRERGLAFNFVFIWFIGTLIMQNFGSVSINNYSPIPLFARYELPLIFPSALLLSIIINDFYITKAYKKKTSVIVFISCVFFFTVISSNEIYSFFKGKIDYDHTISIYKSIKDNSIVHTDNISKLYYDFYNGYNGKAIIQVHHPDSTNFSEYSEGDYILLNSKYLKTYSRYEKGIADDFSVIPDTNKIDLLDYSNSIKLYRIK